MADIAVQASFNSGEWAPTLNARVDQAKYKSGAALLENFFVDYRGGASSRTGTQFIAQAYKSTTQVRIITFQVSFNVGYVLEFGDGYIRFFFNGSAVLKTGFAISGASKANPCVIQVVGNDFAINDWIYVSGVLGMTQLNGKFYKVTNVAGAAVTLANVNGVAIDSTAYSNYTSGGTAAKVYTLVSPYTSADDLRLLKFTQSIDKMIICHPNYQPYELKIISANNWTISAITIGSTVAAPATPAIGTTLAAGTVNYAYGVTSIDKNGQESPMSTPGAMGSKQDIRTVSGSNTIYWTGVSGAVAYNVYKATVSYTNPVPLGVQYGFIGSTKGAVFIDSNIGADFTQTPPVAQNPFIGAGVDTVTVTAPGAYTSVPLVTFVGAATITATGAAQLQVTGTPTISGAGLNHAVNDIVTYTGGLQVQITSVGGGGVITGFTVLARGAISTGATPTNPCAQTSTTGVGTTASMNCVWGVSSIVVLTQGGGYSSAPSVTFSSGAATATTTLTPAGVGNPTVPSFFQQRLVLAAAPGAPETFNLSKPGAYYNFDISSPVRPDDAISGTIISGILNTIKSIVSSTAGMLVLTDKASWLVNGGQSGAAVTPSAIVANAQSFIGANDVPPIVANYDILYVQSKGAGVRDLAYNIYYNVFTGTDISIISSHLFFGHEIVEWGWAEHPFYMVWAVRDDGVMLTLTFLKEQEFIGWSHHHTTNADFKSVAVVTEDDATIGATDSVYTVVERVINGNVVQYIERFTPRIYPNGLTDAWCVDCGVKYTGSATTSFTGGEYLAGETCTGLADGVLIPDFVMPTSGNFTLATPASTVIVGKAYTCKLQTLALDMGEPSIQGKAKKINYVDVRVADTLGIDIGHDFDHLTPMKDLVLGNVSSMLIGQQSQIITGLTTGDARTYLSGAYTIPGQYCIQQSKPYPATILGVFPSFTIGDDR